MPYSFYYAVLVSGDYGNWAVQITFHDGAVWFLRAKSLRAKTKLVEMMSASDGNLARAKSHRSTFEIEWTALIGFTTLRARKQNAPTGSDVLAFCLITLERQINRQ